MPEISLDRTKILDERKSIFCLNIIIIERKKIKVKPCFNVTKSKLDDLKRQQLALPSLTPDYTTTMAG